MTDRDNRKSRYQQKLTKADVLQIVERCQSGETQAAVARDFPVSKAMVGRIMSGLNWSHVTGIDPHKPGYVRGEASIHAKLTRSQVQEIVQRCEAGQCCSTVARDFPVATRQVQAIMRGDAWSHVTGITSGPGLPRGEEIHTAKLTEDDVVEIVQRYEAGEPQTGIARDFPVNQSQVSKIVRGKSWTHVTGIEGDNATDD